MKDLNLFKDSGTGSITEVVFNSITLNSLFQQELGYLKQRFEHFDSRFTDEDFKRILESDFGSVQEIPITSMIMGVSKVGRKRQKGLYSTIKTFKLHLSWLLEEHCRREYNY